MKKTIIVISWMFAAGWLLGQNTLIHFDRPYYLPGQILHYCISSTCTSQDSFIISVRLNLEGQTVNQHYLRLKSGFGIGYLRLPFDLSSGVYTFDVDAFEKKSAEPFALIQAQLSVVGVEETAKTVVQIASTKMLTDNPQNTTIRIAVDKMEVPVREEKLCTINVEGGSAGDRVSIAVRDHGFYDTKGICFQENANKTTALLDQIPIKGIRTLLNTQPKEDAFLFAAEPDNLTFSFSRVSENGDFVIKFPAFLGEKQLFFIDNGRNTLSISLKAGEQVLSTEPLLLPSVGARLNIKSNEDRKKIYQLFSRLEESMIPSDENLENKFITPTYSVDVQDYSVRGTLVDLLKELTTPLKYRKDKDGHLSAKVLYELLGLKYFYEDDPVFFINGIATRDGHYVGSLPLQDIKAIEIYSALETIRDLKLVDIGGVIKIAMVDPLFTIKEELQLPGFDIQGIQVPISYPIQADMISAIPQLKSLLYWNPIGRLDASGQYTFLLAASDDISLFDIEVVHHSSRTTGHAQIKIVYN